MTILICFAACSNSSSSGDGSENEEIDYSLGNAPSEDLKVAETDDSGNKNFSAEENADGIYIKFAIPKDTNSYNVNIDGIGLVTENFFGVGKMTEDDFFYPFLEPNKEYKIRVVFLKAEVEEDGWNLGHPDGDEMIGWFDVTAKAGAKSKGEVRLNDLGKIEVEKNGDFKFTKKPTFKNEDLIQDWILGIGLNEGVSWLHEYRRSKWLAEIDIPNNEVLNKKYNFYRYPRPWGDVKKVDFIVYRPKLSYKYGEKEYRYQWDGYTMDTNCKPEAELWTDIDVTKEADAAKIQGMWTENGEWDVVSIDGYDIKCHEVYTETLSISGINVKVSSCRVYTKSSAFTKEDLLKCRWAYIGGSDGKEETGESNSSENWKLYDSCTLSDDGRTLTEKYENIECPLSEYFADYTSSSSSYTKHYDLKFFSDNLLRIIQSGKDEDGKDYEWYDDYKKQ